MRKRDKYNHIDITGKRFGRLVAIKKVGTSKWLMQCDCGNEIILNYSRLLYGQGSCGCVRKETCQQWGKSHITHGKSNTKLYRKYRGVLNRCYNPNCNSYKRYGGRGIDVCEEWRNSFESFSEWAYANGYDPEKDGHDWSIDRIDNNKGYSPNNCRFATAQEQMRNRNTVNRYEYCGNYYSPSEFADAFGISDKSFVYHRICRGKTFEQIRDDWMVAHDIPDGYIGASEYAKKHSVTTTTVYRWIESGNVQAERRGIKWYIKAD